MKESIEGENESIAHGGPIYIPNLVGPLTRVPDFQASLLSELQVYIFYFVTLPFIHHYGSLTTPCLIIYVICNIQLLQNLQSELSLDSSELCDDIDLSYVVLYHLLY